MSFNESKKRREIAARQDDRMRWQCENVQKWWQKFWTWQKFLTKWWLKLIRLMRLIWAIWWLVFRERFNDVVNDLFETFFASSDDDLYAIDFVLRDQYSINVNFFVIEKSDFKCLILKFLSFHARLRIMIKLLISTRRKWLKKTLHRWRFHTK